ncbi:DUF4013 domain-containing protein [Halobacterium sp. KA-6]|jgi:hypothetical protein|uniref:DUF4013 domain-containing protein n=1 Tax=Halobacterium sp. KA-6 TaxID=2896368 RepID=UPI001E4EB669|nr:DUF4013 domain-containing protein [Halobacterium sp. KA-6]MCD2204354.1 DUF4013 domain-containing protein [Halobacterium sp. KA-6]
MVPAPFAYPFRGERGFDTLLAGGALHLLSVYVPVAPLVVVLGYLLVVLRETAGRDADERFDALPPLGNIREILRLGVGGTVVVAAFLLPAAVTLLVTVAGATQFSLPAGEIPFTVSLGFALGSTTSLLLAVAFVYLLPAALANYLATGRLRAAIDLDVLRRAAAHGGYFYDVLVGVVVGSLLLIVARATTPFAVGFFVAFYAEVVTIAFWSRGVSRAIPDVVDAA